MQVQTRQGPAYGVARLTLGPNEPVKVEGGAMMAMSAGVTLAAKAEGGIMKSLKRAALGGESFFVSTYTAPPQGGFVDVAARLPGDITTHDIAPGQALFISEGLVARQRRQREHRRQVGRLQEHVRQRGRLHRARRGPGHRGVRLLRRARGVEPAAGPVASPSTPATWSPTRTPSRWASARPAAAAWCRASRAVRASCSTSPAPARCGPRPATRTELQSWIMSFVGTS